MEQVERFEFIDATHIQQRAALPVIAAVGAHEGQQCRQDRRCRNIVDRSHHRPARQADRMRIIGDDHPRADPAKAEWQQSAAIGQLRDHRLRLVERIDVAVPAADRGKQLRQREIASLRRRIACPCRGELGITAVEVGLALVSIKAGMQRGQQRADRFRIAARRRGKGRKRKQADAQASDERAAADDHRFGISFAKA